MVIAGFSGIGKTELAKKYKNVIDLDAAPYVYDDSDILDIPFEERKGMKRKDNSEWPNNYIKAIKEAIIDYDFVLVWDREDIIYKYLEEGINFTLCYPNVDDLILYSERFKDRGNTDEYIDWKTNQYYEKISFYESISVDKIVLKNNETLEDYFIKNGFNLIKR